MTELTSRVWSFRRWFPIAIVAMILVIIPAYLYGMTRPVVYEAAARLVVRTGPAPQSDALVVTRQLAADYAQVAGTIEFAQAVSRVLGVPVDPQELLLRVSATPDLGSPVIVVKGQGSTPEEAAELTDAAAQVLLNEQLTTMAGDVQAPSTISGFLTGIRDQAQRDQERLDSLLALSDPTGAQLIEISRLQERLGSLWDGYGSLLGLANTYDAFRLESLESAILPTTPTGMPAWVYAAMGAVTALILLVAVGSFATYLADDLRTTRDIGRATGLPVLGLSLERPQDIRKGGPARIVTLRQPASPAAESYRTLRANLELSAGDRPFRSLAVTGTLPAPGKDAVAVNLAVAFAQAGKRTLIIDADLRNPTVHTLIGLAAEPGLSSILAFEGGPIVETIHKTEHLNLHVLTSGAGRANPGDMIGSGRMREVIAQALAEHDMVIITAPPLPGVADGAILASAADATLLVVEATITKGRSVRSAMHALGVGDPRLLGVAVHVPAQSARSSAAIVLDEPGAVTREGVLGHAGRP